MNRKNHQRANVRQTTAPKKAAVKAKAKAPVKTAVKATTGVSRKGRTSAAARPKATAALRKNPFAGASEVSITQNKIAVTRSSNQSGKGNYKSESTRSYHDKTPANMKALDELMNGQTVKKVTVKFKG